MKKRGFFIFLSCFALVAPGIQAVKLNSSISCTFTPTAADTPPDLFEHRD